MSEVNFPALTAQVHLLAESFRAMAASIARAFDVPMRFVWLEEERPADRARRLHVERAMRARTRRARRKGRLGSLR